MALENFLCGDDPKINQLLEFTALVDNMTLIKRRTLHVDGSERENDAEHSWHIALMALLFKDYAPKNCDINKSIRMCLVHDLVEIYAGDTFAYDIQANKDKQERENLAADKLFSKLPKPLGQEIRSLWEEFDQMQTPEAQYAAAMDRLQPNLHNSLTDGHTWKEGKTTEEQVNARLEITLKTIPELNSWYQKNLEKAKKEGWIK